MLSKTRRTTFMLGSLATLLALWLGLTAPSASPVAPTVPVVQPAPIGRP